MQSNKLLKSSGQPTRDSGRKEFLFPKGFTPRKIAYKHGAVKVQSVKVPYPKELEEDEEKPRHRRHYDQDGYIPRPERSLGRGRGRAFRVYDNHSFHGHDGSYTDLQSYRYDDREYYNTHPMFEESKGASGGRNSSERQPGSFQASPVNK